jgi:flagellar biosynthesis GTPase FlhF
MSTPGELLEALGREARARLGNGRDGGTRVYRGRSVDELVPQIQRDLGAEAIILRRREGLTGGVLGFFQHPYVEIEAMQGAPGVDVYDEEGSPAPYVAPAPAAPSMPADRPAVPVAPPASTASPTPLAARRAAQQYAPAPEPPFAPAPPPPAPLAPRAAPSPGLPPVPPAVQPLSQQRPTFDYRSGSMRQAQPPPPPSPPAFRSPTPPTPPTTPSSPVPSPPVASPFYSREAAAPAATGSAYVTAHLAALARADRARTPPRASIPQRREDEPGWTPAFEELAASGAGESYPPARERPAPPRRVASERRVVAPGSHSRARAGVSKTLQRCGISEQLADELIDGASAHALALAPRSGLAQAVRATLAQRIPVAPSLPAQGAAIVVVGAGGAGKTTCCAALLGAYRRSSSLPASFATLTRESERGELRMILSPFLMKPTSASATRALRALRRARSDGMAVIDTPSLSPSDRAGVRELAQLLAEMEPERVVVALPATLGATAAAQLLQALRPLGANALAVTHADETDQIGVAVEAACRFGLAPEFMLDRGRTGGWRLRQVSPTALAEKLLP